MLIGDFIYQGLTATNIQKGENRYGLKNRPGEIHLPEHYKNRKQLPHILLGRLPVIIHQHIQGNIQLIVTVFLFISCRAGYLE